MKQWITRITLVGAFTLATACGSAGEEATPAVAATAPPTAAHAFVIAEMEGDVSKKVKHFLPLADHLATKLSAYGYTEGGVRTPANLDELAAQIKAGQIDMVVDSPYPAMLNADRTGAQPILRRWKGGEAEYNSVIFARADHGMATLEDLSGRFLAVEDRSSTSGYFLPTAELITHGLLPLSGEGMSRPPTIGEFGYVFTGGTGNTVERVLAGRVDAGAVEPKAYANLPEATRARLVVLGETERVARHIVLVRPDMEPALLAALKAELLQLDSNEDGSAVLDAFEKTTRFDDFPIGANLDRMRALFVTVNAAVSRAGISPAAQTAR